MFIKYWQRLSEWGHNWKVGSTCVKLELLSPRQRLLSLAWLLKPWPPAPARSHMVLAAPCSFLRHILDLLEKSWGWGRARPGLECLPGISFCFSLRDSPASFSSWQAHFDRSQAVGLGDCSWQRRWPQGACRPPCSCGPVTGNHTWMNGQYHIHF